MSGQLTAEFVLRMADEASAPAGRALTTMARQMRNVAGESKRASAAAISAWQKMGTARETLGIRSEREIQREIQRTEAAYNRLARSGQASAREQARAFDAMRARVGELRRELGQADSLARRLGAGARGGVNAMAQGVAGFQAARYVMAEPVRKTMGYDLSLAHLANTAYAGESNEAKRAGVKALDAGIVSAVRAGGGTRESAMGALDRLVASGAFSSVDEAIKLLPTLTVAATGANADAATLAGIAIRGKQTFGLTDTGLALDQAIRAGQLGGFELRDMERWLPQQMAAARQAGLSGDEGFRTLLAANQAAVITAGSPDEAGNNLVNLLAKISSRDTAEDAKKLGIDLAGSLAAAREKGTNGLDAFVNLATRVASQDKRFTALRERAATATGAEQQDTYNSMADILQGSAIGELIQDRQALMALVGIMGNRDEMMRIRGELVNAEGTAAAAHAGIAQSPAYKTEQAAIDAEISRQAAMERVNELLGAFAEGLSDIARKYPVLAAVMVGLTDAAKVAAAAMLAVAGAGLLMGGDKTAGRGGAGQRVMDTIKKLWPGGGAATGTAEAAGQGGAWRALGLGALPLAAIWGAAEWAGDPNTPEEGRADSWVAFSNWLAKLLPDPTAAARERYEAQRAELNPRQTIQTIVQIDGRTVAEAVNEYNGQQAGRN